jgi:hypothetical protein
MVNFYEILSLSKKNRVTGKPIFPDLIAYLLLALLDHSAISSRQFCILADWTISKLCVTPHRIR